MNTSVLFQVLKFSGNFVDEMFHMETAQRAANLGLDGALNFYSNKINEMKKGLDFNAAKELMGQGWALVTSQDLVIQDGAVFKSNCQYFGQKQIEQMLSQGAVLVR